MTHIYVKDSGIITDILAKPPGTGDDFTDLDEGDFYKLGTGGVVGDVGPEFPKPNLDPIGIPPDAMPAPAPVPDPVITL